MQVQWETATFTEWSKQIFTGKNEFPLINAGNDKLVEQWRLELDSKLDRKRGEGTVQGEIFIQPSDAHWCSININSINFSS